MYQFTTTNLESRTLTSRVSKLNGLIKELRECNKRIVSNLEFKIINLQDNVEFDYGCDEIIILIRMIIRNINNLLSMNHPDTEYLTTMLNDYLQYKEDYFVFKSRIRAVNYLDHVEDIINIYHKFYDNGFNAQLKPNDYKPVFSKTIDNNLFEVVLVIPELSISKDEYNCISVNVFINGELDSPIFDLTQLDEVFSFINNYNV